VASSLINPESDLEYLGAFRLPDEESNDTSWSYGGHGMGYYPLGDPGGESDGFPGSLFSISHPYQNFVSEFSIPAPVISPDKNVDDLPVATTLQSFADVTAGRQTGGLTGTTLGDIQYYPQQGAQTTDKLYWVMYEYYLPDPEEVSFGWCELDFANLQSQGTWRLDDFPFSATSKYLFDIPQGWADAHTPGKYLAAGRNRLVNNGSWGPALYAYGPWNDGNPPFDGSSLDAVEMLKYDSDHMLHNYSHSDDWSDGAWLTAGDKSAVILVGMKAMRTSASGAEYYGEPSVDGCGYKGYHAEPYYGAILFYDPQLLAEVLRGTIQRHEVQPYAVFNPEDYMFKQGCRRTILGGVGYDHERNLLYVMEKGVEGYYARKPIVHVFRVSDQGQAPDLTAPTVPTNLQASTVMSDRVDFSWDASSDDVHLVGYIVYRNGDPIATTVETSYSDGKVNPSATYSYTLTAWDARSNWSASSLPLVVTTLAGVDERKPIISDIKATDVAGTGVMLSWRTDELATTILEYGIQYSGEETTYEDATLTTTHRVVLTDLTPDVTYTYHATSVDATGLVTHTNEYPSKSFRTNSAGGLRNSEPVLNGIGSKRVSAGEQLEFVVRADDLNDDVLLYSTTDLPPGASFNPDTGQFDWTPGFELAGTYPVTFTVSDGQASDDERVTIFVEDNPMLVLSGVPADRAIHLSWQVSAPLPPTSAWQINYGSQTGSVYLPITGIVSPTRAYTLTELTNYVWYTVTLNAMLDASPILTDTVRVMPADRFVYLPLILRGN
ncbi:MAG: fibronectin type III domain-containing protein, partial [Anaerolineae bacterium]